MIKTTHRTDIHCGESLSFMETSVGTLQVQTCETDEEESPTLTPDEAIDLGKRLAAWGRRMKKATVGK